MRADSVLHFLKEEQRRLTVFDQRSQIKRTERRPERAKAGVFFCTSETCLVPFPQENSKCRKLSKAMEKLPNTVYSWNAGGTGIRRSCNKETV